MRKLIMSLIATAACTTAVTVPPLADAATEVHPGAHTSGSIAFMRPGEIGQYDVWVVRPDASGMRRLTRAPLNRSDYNPDWSPDGSRVLFERRVLEDGDDGIRFRELSTPEAGEEDHYPTWSPDGRTIVFMRNFADVPQTPTKLMAVDVANGMERVVYRFPAWAPGAGDPKFSPNGKRILFTYWCTIAVGGDCPDSTRSPRNAKLATIRPDGTGLRLLHLHALADSGTWAPDGRRIAFRCQPQLGTIRLCASRLNGSDLSLFPFAALASVHPDWGTQP